MQLNPIVKSYIQQIEVGHRYHLFSHSNWGVFQSLFLDKVVSHKAKLEKSGWRVFFQYDMKADSSLEIYFEAEHWRLKWVFKRRNLKSRDEILDLWIKLRDLDLHQEKGKNVKTSFVLNFELD